MRRWVLSLIIIILSFPLFYGQTSEKSGIKGIDGSPLTDINVRAITELTVASEYNNGFFLKDNGLIAFRAPDQQSYKNYDLSKFIICDREGKVLKEIRRVVWWGGGPLILKLNALSSLLLVNMETGVQKIVRLDANNIDNISINPFNNRILFTYGPESNIREYDIETHDIQVVARLDNGMFGGVFQLSPNEIIFIRTDMKLQYSMDDIDPWIKIELPLFVINLKKHQCVQLAKISSCGTLFHFDYKKNSVNFIIEEKGFLKFISSDVRMHNKTINITHLNHDTKKVYEGLLLDFSSLNEEGSLVATTRVRLLKKEVEDSDKFNFEYYSLDPGYYKTESADIYLLDLHGNHKQLTDTKNEFELVCDWNAVNNDILYCHILSNRLVHLPFFLQLHNHNKIMHSHFP